MQLIGILLIGFNEKTGPYVDIQFPSLLLEVEDIDISSLKEFYEEQRNRMEGPIFLIKEFKPELIGSFFYTGYSVLHYVGRPGYGIFIFFSEEKDIPEKLEGMIRRLAHELLPQKETPTFTSLFHDYYDLIKKSELGEFWDEIGEKQPIQENLISETPDTTIVDDNSFKHIEDKQNLKEILEAEKSKVFELTLHLDQLKKQLEDLDNELQTKIEELEEKDRVIEKLEIENNSLKESSENSVRQVVTIKNQEQEIRELNKKLEEFQAQVNELMKLQDIVEKSKQQEEELDIKSKELEELQSQIENLRNENEKLNKSSKDYEMLSVQNNQLQSKFDEISLEIKDITSQNAQFLSNNAQLKEEVGSLKAENNNFLTTITDLKLELKNIKEKNVVDSQAKEKIDDEIIDLKKEIKVLRRERDHYKQNVKEKNLL